MLTYPELFSQKNGILIVCSYDYGRFLGAKLHASDSGPRYVKKNMCMATECTQGQVEKRAPSSPPGEGEGLNGAALPTLEKLAEAPTFDGSFVENLSF